MAALRMLFDLMALVAWVTVIVKVAKKPAANWRHGWFGKIGSILVALVFYATVGGWFVPWGAAVVWRRRLGSRRDDFDIPMADGRKR